MKKDGLGNPIDPEAPYIVQDTRQVVGNCAMWWGVNRSGYFCELTKAGVYMGRAVEEMRDTDVPWPIPILLNRVSVHIDVQTLEQVKQEAGS